MVSHSEMYVELQTHLLMILIRNSSEDDPLIAIAIIPGVFVICEHFKAKTNPVRNI